jgi:4-carboxymuconolactone decarboxylase
LPDFGIDNAQVGQARPAWERVGVRGPLRESYAACTQRTLLGDAWQRRGLAARDRGIVTLAALVTRNQTVEMPYRVNLALDYGVKVSQISEIMARLAFYVGWPNAFSALPCSGISAFRCNADSKSSP